MKPPRYWDAAIAKRDRERVCRVCGSQFWVQCAHLAGREFDEVIDLDDGTSVRFVEPSETCPLCMDCHRAYDARELDLLPHLTYDEQSAVVRHLGITRALHRLTGQRLIPADMPSA